ncbi:MAG TPA: response regulator transcription factor [Trebonia sp.]|jgi:DNA-binding NarL/FixJ family response regulator|nr:response regulator transcription factor [Trebonia sp.]
MTVRVLIADDQRLVRAGFRLILERQPDIEVVGEAASGAEAVTLARQLVPDVVLMDIRMPDLDGIQATRLIRADPGLKTARIIILTTFDLDEYVYLALRAGASGFLLKDLPPEQLAQAVFSASQGDTLLAPAITRRLIEHFTATGHPAAAPQALGQLTPREVEVLRLLATGLSNAEIAAALFVAETTVKTHVARMLTKLGLRDRVQAVVFAYQHGLVPPRPT